MCSVMFLDRWLLSSVKAKYVLIMRTFFILMANDRCLRQRGVLSVYLFSFYLDLILKDVSDMPHGFKLGK